MKSLTTKALTITLGLLVAGVASAQQSGADWLKLIDDAEHIESSYGTFKQTITTSTGRERTLEARSWSTEGGDVSLMVYTAPARVAGDKILQREGGDQIWYYMKRRDVTRHFVGSARKQSAMGSDFSYEDMASGDMTEDYTATVLGEEKVGDVECIKLNCVPTETGPSYEHLILWAGKEDHLTRRIDYYDEQGHLKTLIISDFTTIEGRKLGLMMVMTNLREGSHTSIEQADITFKVNPDPTLFTKSSLTRDLSNINP